ncbi:TetR family transcriptional regulator [Saccharomonospora sp. NPDC006951]
MNTAQGLRERKKIATREALHEAALKLAMEHGFDRLTVEAIADAATVSRRTFSNYFASKEEALLYGDGARMASMLDAVRARPAAESPWTALTASLRTLFPERGPDEDWIARARFIRSHPSLLVQQLATFSSFEKELAAELASRLPERERSTTRARLIAGCFFTAIRVATVAWLDQPQGTSLLDIAEQALAEAAAPFD